MAKKPIAFRAPQFGKLGAANCNWFTDSTEVAGVLVHTSYVPDVLLRRDPRRVLPQRGHRQGVGAGYANT